MVAAGGGRFAAAWSARTSVTSATIAHGGFRAVTVHGRLSRWGWHDVALDRAANRLVTWAAADGVHFQRVSPEGTPAPPLLLQSASENDVLGPEILAVERDGSAWVVWEVRDVVIARRVPARGEPGPPVRLFDANFYIEHASVVGATGDGAGGMFALVSWDNVDDTAPSGGGAMEGLAAVHVTRAGAVKRGRVIRRSAGTVSGALVGGSGGARVVYHSSSARRRGVYLRTLAPGAVLSRPRRLARKGEVIDATRQPGARRMLVLLRTSGETDNLFLLRVPRRGPARRLLRVAKGGYRPEGDGRAITAADVALDSHGRTFLTWETDVDAAFVRAGFGRRLGPIRAIWRCWD